MSFKVEKRAPLRNAKRKAAAERRTFDVVVIFKSVEVVHRCRKCH